MKAAMIESVRAAAAAGATLLVPHREIGAALFDAIERAHRAAGRELWPTPRVRELKAWLIERHHDEPCPTPAHLRVLGEVEERELWLEVVSETGAAPPAMEPAVAVHAARRAWRAMAEHGIPLAAIEAEQSEETSALAEWCRQFEARCQALDCISADRLWPALASVRWHSAAEPLAWLDSPSWSPAARRWLEAEVGQALAPPEVAAREGSARRWRFTAPARELAAVAAWMRARAASEPDFRAWICIPDLARRRAAVEDAFDAELAPERFSLRPGGAAAPRYALAGGLPLARQAPVQLALELLALSHGPVPFERFSTLLRAPALAREATDTEAARLDLELRRKAVSEAPLGQWLDLAQRLDGGRATAALDRLRRAHAALGALSGRHPVSRWVVQWMGAFEAGPWASSARWSSSEFQAAERCRELLAELAVGDRIFGRLTRASAEGLLQRAARDTAFQAQTGIPAIWVSAELHDPWLPYDAIWVTGCDEQRWPPPPSPVPLLPVRLQRRFGIVAAAASTQLSRAEELQHRWRARAAELCFSSTDNGVGQSGRASGLLSVFAAPAQGADDELSPRTQPHWWLQHRAAPLLETLRDEVAPPFGAGERTRGVATLRAQSRCAFRGFAVTRLEVEALRLPRPGFNDAERGTLVHDALERLWRGLEGSTALAALSPEAQQRIIGEAVQVALARACARRDPGGRWRAREQRRLEGLLARWLDVERRRPSFQVERLEGATPAIVLGGLPYEVRIDRVDRLPEDGACVLIDYKSGAVSADWRHERPDNPQLPLYALTVHDVLAAVAYARVNAADCGFVAETDRPAVLKPNGRKTSLEGHGSLAELRRVWEQRLSKLAADVAAGRAVLDPTPTACASCELQGLCRINMSLIEVDS